ncbi:alpha-1,3-mannosyltransferase CMT1 [Hypoxylon trugodes]|uniref:alpha-1,3-mannosyltransferase CMT1 n=1 Tax=Hypoxylon trugodes TaxID=326681 RepID=UPI00219ED8A4|nr:alpha-1,3-mannosyltransferase CMT1 [Hypoxylon trugodes]KAI1388052.1 alpha-1,3-mannosyltransferase CMT1 [Hypoxylon trugodes]
MMLRGRRIIIQVACIFLVTITIWIGYQSFSPESWDQWRHYSFHPDQHAPISPANTEDKPPPPSTTQPEEIVSHIPTSTPEPEPEPVALDSSFDTTSYIKAIFDPSDTTFPRLECPAPDSARYEYLKAPIGDGASQELKYYFALDLRQSIKVLPRLLGSTVEAIRFLGPSNCVLSIVEGNSNDGTREVLYALRPELKDLVVTYYVQSSELDPGAGERIEKLAKLRNLALSPLLSIAGVPGYPKISPQSALVPNANTTVIFLNDVALCVNDILELAHQRAFQSADMTCAMDWTYVGRDPTFYDVWVARTIQGDLFFDIPPDGNWNSAWNLFWNDGTTRGRFSRTLPFQVFACWNGAVTFGAGPILGEQSSGDGEKEERIEFRASREGECHSGEPTLFCKDLWRTGHGRIAVVPSVNLEYSDEAAAKIKALKGYTSRWTEQEDAEAMKIPWVETPPDTITCMPGLGDQTRRPWNETFV